MRGLISAGVLLAVLIASSSTAEARWRLFRRTRTAAPAVHFSGGPGAVAAQKASYMASRGIFRHLGGSFGGARYEGIGMGATPAAAYANCCYRGQKTIAGQACYQCSNGMYYAVTLYW